MDNLVKKAPIDPNKPHRISNGDGFDDVPLLSYDKEKQEWVSNVSIESIESNR